MAFPSSNVVTASWPVPGDASSLLSIVIEQSQTIAAKAELIDSYQDALNAVQSPPAGSPTTATGAITTGATTSLAVTGVSGAIVNGATVTGTANSTAPTVLGQISGAAGSDGTYLLSAPVSLTAATPLTFTPPAQAGSWPIPQDAPTLDLILQTQSSILRTQTALVQHYQDLLNQSQVAPPSGS